MTSRLLSWSVRAAEVALGVGTIICLILLGVRASIRLDDAWDSWMYHIPFAARHGGLHVPYQVSDHMRMVWEGFPPLPEFFMGALWRVTGSIHAVGVVNYLALVAFLAVGQRKFRAPFYVVAPIALTAPLVLIHAATSYVDLFSSTFLAVSLAAVAYAYLSECRDRSLLVIGLAGLVGAAWSKMLLFPLVGLGFLFHVVVYRPWRIGDRSRRSSVVVLFLAAMTVIAAPYVKNMVTYHNPVWPVKMPIAGELFPHGPEAPITNARPATLLHASQPEIFFRSLFEVGRSTQHWPRWNIDSWDSAQAFRSGGYWNVAVVAYLAVAAGMLISLRGRKGRIVCLAAIGVLGLVAFLPQSNELRYYMFLPLSWAALIGMLYPDLKRRRPILAVSLLVMVSSLFLYVGHINRAYYMPQRAGYLEAAKRYQADELWSQMKPGFTYCAIGKAPGAFFLTGPTMHEFNVVEVEDPADEGQCPAGSIHIRGNTIYDNAAK